MIYYCLFLLLMFYSFLSFMKIKNDVINFEVIIVCVIGILLTGFRDGIGNDYQNYVNIYNSTDDFGILDFSGQIEPGFSLLISILKALNFSSQSLFIVASFFIVIGLVDLSRKFDVKFFPLIILLVYCRLFFYFNLNILRQALAAIIVYYGLNSDSSIKRFFCICLSIFFHISAFFMLPLSFILDVREKKIIKFCIIVSIAIVFFNYSGVITMKLVSIFVSIPKFEFYDNNFTSVGSIFALNSLYLKYFCIYFLYKLQNDDVARKLLIINIYSLFIFIFTFMFGEIFNRLMLYFEIYMIFSFIKIIKYNRGKIINFLFVPFLYYYYFSAMKNFVTTWEDMLLPFRFYNFI